MESNRFTFADNSHAKVLVGTYRSDKAHYDWIMGNNPVRKTVLYNVRYNADLFSTRDGGVQAIIKPEYVLLYDRKGAANLFSCSGASVLDEQMMHAVGYPNPQGTYVVYNLEAVHAFCNVDALGFVKHYQGEHKEVKKAEPIYVSGSDLIPFEKENSIINQNMTIKTIYRSIDLFAGIGGIRRGFDNAFGKQVETVFVSEWDKPATQTYRANYPLDKFEIAGDITKVEEKEIPAFDICLAGFPCQAFSMAGKRQGFNDDYKGRCRGTLFMDVARICEHHQPKVIFCENVKGLTNHDKGNTFRVITETFEGLGYKVFAKVLNSKDFGVPQQRERIYIVCFRNDIAPASFEFPEGSKKKVCIRDIMDPAPVPAKYYLSEQYLSTLKAHRARHEAAGHGFGYVVRDLDGISGTIVCGGMGRETNLIKDEREHSMTPSTNIKGEINKESIRKMTPREWARLQGYPDSFILPLCDGQLYKQFGNSVSVPVIEAIANQIFKVLENK